MRRCCEASPPIINRRSVTKNFRLAVTLPKQENPALCVHPGSNLEQKVFAYLKDCCDVVYSEVFVRDPSQNVHIQIHGIHILFLI